MKLTDRKDLAMIAVQGPEAMDVTKNIFPTSAEQIAQLKPFKFYHENDLSGKEQKLYNHRYKAIQKLIPIIRKELGIKI